MKAKISEIFRSIQGEGKYLGIDQIFIRFHSCNMNCLWCDTSISLNNNDGEIKSLSISDVIKKIDELGCGYHSISLTGGEPLLQRDFLLRLLPELKKKSILIYLETNGVLFKELSDVIDYIDIISADIKLPSSTGEKEYWDEHKLFLATAIKKDVFIKSVITKDTLKIDVEKAIDIIYDIDPSLSVILQPETSEIKKGAVEKCIEYQQLCYNRLNNVRIIPQVHKFMEVK